MSRVPKFSNSRIKARQHLNLSDVAEMGGEFLSEVPNALVVAIETSTAVKHDSQTNADGNLTFPDLQTIPAPVPVPVPANGIIQVTDNVSLNSSDMTYVPLH